MHISRLETNDVLKDSLPTPRSHGSGSSYTAVHRHSSSASYSGTLGRRTQSNPRSTSLHDVESAIPAEAVGATLIIQSSRQDKSVPQRSR